MTIIESLRDEDSELKNNVVDKTTLINKNLDQNKIIIDNKAPKLP